MNFFDNAKKHICNNTGRTETMFLIQNMHPEEGLETFEGKSLDDT